MPLYDYQCPECGAFEALAPIARSSEPQACPECSAQAPRAILSAPFLATMNAGTRVAMQTNERASHAPRSSRDAAGSYGRMRHPSGCGCCTPGKRGATVTADNGAKTFPGRRPWMISH